MKPINTLGFDKSEKSFCFFAAACALLTGFTTIAIHQIWFPVGSFAQNVQLYQNEAYLSLHWIILAHCLLVLCSMLGVALVLAENAKPLAILGFVFFCVFVFTEWQRTLGTLWHVNGLRRLYVNTTDAETLRFLQHEIQTSVRKSGSLFLLFIAAFALGNACYGVALLGRKGFDRWLGGGLLVWSGCTALAFVQEFASTKWIEPIVDANNKIYQPLIRFAIGCWLLMKAWPEKSLPTMMRPFFATLFICTVLAGFAQPQQLVGDTGYARSKGVNIFYRSVGEGLPVVIINGGPGMNSEGFAAVAQRLSTGNQAILFDQRGTGRSRLQRLDTSTITLDLMVQDLEAVRRHLRIDRWAVLCHSFGGMLASYYATRHPAAIRALIFSHSGGIDLDLLRYVGDTLRSRLTSVQLQSLTNVQNEIAAGDASEAACKRRAEALAPAYVYDDRHAATIARGLMENNSIINGLVWQNLQRMRFDCAPGLSHFKSPVLIVQGRQDVVSVQTAVKAQRVLPNARLVLLDRCGTMGNDN